jgi:hypothetical protein
MSYRDYQLLLALDNTMIEFGTFDRNGNLANTNKSDTNFSGFKGRLFKDTQWPKVGADKAKQMHFHIVCPHVSQFGENFEVIETAYDYLDVVNDVNPVGLDLKVATAYNGDGLVIVKATYRGTDVPYAGLTTAGEWKVLRAYGAVGVTIAVTSFANAALGEYSLTIKDGTPAVLTTNVMIQGVKTATSLITHITSPLLIKP